MIARACTARKAFNRRATGFAYASLPSCALLRTRCSCTSAFGLPSLPLCVPLALRGEGIQMFAQALSWATGIITARP